jgi:hypothetical protein
LWKPGGKDCLFDVLHHDLRRRVRQAFTDRQDVGMFVVERPKKIGVSRNFVNDLIFSAGDQPLREKVSSINHIHITSVHSVA